MNLGRLSSKVARRSGFTLTEALVCITILALTGSSIFLAVESTMFTSEDSLDETVAHGLAMQMLDEAAGLPFVEKGTRPGSLGPEESAPASGARIGWDDLDDSHGYTVTGPLRDRFGQVLGTGNGGLGQRPENFRLRSSYFTNWRITTTVTYVDSNNQEASGVTDYRRVRVLVEKHAPARNSRAPWRTLATAERVFAYVPPLN